MAPAGHAKNAEADRDRGLAGFLSGRACPRYRGPRAEPGGRPDLPGSRAVPAHCRPALESARGVLYTAPLPD
jgi:hypothetical protein